MEISNNPPHRASTSFNDDELLALEAILNVVRKGGDARIIARQPAAVRAAQKVQRMRVAIEERKAGSTLTKGGAA